MMLELAAEYPEYRETAKKVKLVDTSSGAYYGKGYQDVQNRVPKIEGTMTDLNWAPKFAMREALVGIFDSYKDKLVDARAQYLMSRFLEEKKLLAQLFLLSVRLNAYS